MSHFGSLPPVRLTALGPAREPIVSRAALRIETTIAPSQSPEAEIASLKQQLAAAQTEISTLKADLNTTIKAAQTDALTGIYNRKYGMGELDREIDRLIRYHPDHPLSFIMLDIDNFKSKNTIHGHQGGDHVLSEVAKAINGALRSTDILFRYGGEEFAVILPETPLSGAQATAEKIRKIVEELDLTYDRRKVPITISGGVTSFEVHSDNAVSFIARADQALYLAKNSGRNRIIAAKQLAA